MWVLWHLCGSQGNFWKPVLTLHLVKAGSLASATTLHAPSQLAHGLPILLSPSPCHRVLGLQMPTTACRVLPRFQGLSSSHEAC